MQVCKTLIALASAWRKQEFSDWTGFKKKFRDQGVWGINLFNDYYNQMFSLNELLKVKKISNELSKAIFMVHLAESKRRLRVVALDSISSLELTSGETNSNEPSQR